MNVLVYEASFIPDVLKENLLDKNVYFVDGEALTELCQDSGTVDNCHPTDFGFASMAKSLGDVFAKL